MASEIELQIADAKKRLGKRLFILGHYYQRDEIIQFADATGDSLELSKAAAKNRDAEFIVFCGVKFMAEIAKILASSHQRVFLPNTLAGCPLAEMADLSEIQIAWKRLGEIGVAGDIMPITYVNSSAELKAFCGVNGGATCTSSSAKRLLEWGFANRKKVFFFPDRNLGLNSARELGISRDEILVWNSERVDDQQLERCKLILWNGFCHVHTFFNPQHVMQARALHPDCKVVVHPECNEGVVEISDAVGSTSFIKEYVEKLEEGSTVVVGTEVTFVRRLARQNQNKKVLPLANSICPNMFRTGLQDLLSTLDSWPTDREIFVPDDVGKGARLALERMMAKSPSPLY